jgi:hypothetical protein
MTTCTRPGCDKTLRANNTKGECGSGCLSPDAPPAKRAKGPALKSTSSARSPGAVAKFRLVAEGLGLDPEAMLEEFASEWLALLKSKATEA